VIPEKWVAGQLEFAKYASRALNAHEIMEGKLVEEKQMIS
jgi:hypothetical protein